MSDPSKKRVSLKVLRDDDDEERSATSWIFLGALAILALLVPIGGSALSIADKTRGNHVWPIVVASFASIAFCSFVGGWLAGRFGRGVLGRHGAAAGVIAGLALWAIGRSLRGGVVIVLTVVFAVLGVRAGRRARSKAGMI